MTTRVIFCLSYDLLNELFIAFKMDIISAKMHCCHGRRHDVNCSNKNVNNALAVGCSPVLKAISAHKVMLYNGII